jgi:hypothetical protein
MREQPSGWRKKSDETKFEDVEMGWVNLRNSFTVQTALVRTGIAASAPPNEECLAFMTVPPHHHARLLVHALLHRHAWRPCLLFGVGLDITRIPMRVLVQLGAVHRNVSHAAPMQLNTTVRQREIEREKA